MHQVKSRSFLDTTTTIILSSDLSHPKQAGSFNDALVKVPVEKYPIVNPGSVTKAIAIIFALGRKVFFSKADVGAAYKLLAVQIAQRQWQCYKYGFTLFMVRHPPADQATRNTNIPLFPGPLPPFR